LNRRGGRLEERGVVAVLHPVGQFIAEADHLVVHRAARDNAASA
jgi:hypothetical protein